MVNHINSKCTMVEHIKQLAKQAPAYLSFQKRTPRLEMDRLKTAQPMTNRNSMQMRQSNLVVSVRPRPPVPVSPEISFKFGGRKINSSRVRKSRSSNRHRKHLKPLNLLRSPLQKPVSRGCGQAVDENAGNSTADIDRSMPNSVTTKPMKVEGLRRRSSGAERITR
ncbi:uncharacterized protein LOC120425644 isoform X3 [Culex pipiens pallens]|uniref:uncharacterized protein LOC120425644 isoform X3 n=1 Tax=Culex pipiens pallens TaxID=42434 RepID=UPI001953ECBE|nr:uncharacterized protein LOC120425644 isoform X3 [Culex pipiens pallens]